MPGDVSRNLPAADLDEGEYEALRQAGLSALRANDQGEWVPDIPLPLFTWPHRHRCECGRSFWTMGGYRGHYALAHILKTP